MNIGKMKNKITIQKSTVVIDSYGNHRNTWVDVYSPRCSVSEQNSMSGYESMKEGVVSEGINTITFTVRYCETLKTVKTNTHRVVFENEKFDIVNVNGLSHENKIVMIVCKKDGAVNG